MCQRLIDAFRCLASPCLPSMYTALDRRGDPVGFDSRIYGERGGTCGGRGGAAPPLDRRRPAEIGRGFGGSTTKPSAAMGKRERMEKVRGGGKGIGSFLFGPFSNCFFNYFFIFMVGVPALRRGETHDCPSSLTFVIFTKWFFLNLKNIFLTNSDKDITSPIIPRILFIFKSIFLIKQRSCGLVEDRPLVASSFAKYNIFINSCAPLFLFL